MPTGKVWEKRIEEFCNEIAADDALGDEDYCTVLEDLISRAETMLDAKREEMEEREEDDDEDDEELDDED